MSVLCAYKIRSEVIEDVYGRERTWMLRKSDSRAGESLPEKVESRYVRISLLKKMQEF